MVRNLPTSLLSKIDEVQIFPRKGQLYQLRGGEDQVNRCDSLPKHGPQ